MDNAERFDNKRRGDSNSNDKLTPQEQFKHRESRELVIAYSGPVGSGTGLVIEETEKLLEAAAYTVTRIKLSDFIKSLYLKNRLTKVDLNNLTANNRYERLQDAGNELREFYKQQDLFAQIAVSKIATHRLEQHPDKEIDEIVPQRHAFLIDQLKRPEEARLLQVVYGNLFYLVGVLCTHDQRKVRLTDEEHLEPEDAEKIMQRDQKQSLEHGQKLDKTLELGDYFIRNTHSSREALSTQLQRLINLIHGKNGVTPTQHEYAMYVAYAAGAQSACLSRQVGAAITSNDGTIIATGRNDVPKAGGGLYTEADAELDRRCVNKEGGKCFNDHHKKRIKDQIHSILLSSKIGQEKADALAEEIYGTTRLKDLLEFSRSIHAEMDAITSVARDGGCQLRGGYLYTTTFPCHNCARHIIAAGLRRVYYIQPYEKSLATSLHGDDIELDPSEPSSETSKTQFIHFEGVAPRQYLTFFHAKSERKTNTGLAIDVTVPSSPKVSAQYLDPYVDLESKVAAHVAELAIEIDAL